MVKILKVVQQSEALAVPSKQSETGETKKSTIVLQEFGGKYADQYVATMFGGNAECRFYAGDVVIAVLRFASHEHNGVNYQDVTVSEIQKINS